MYDKASPFLAKRPSRNDVALQRLRQALVIGEIAAGAAFGEEAVANRFQLGRAAVRVALTSLAASGFVTRNPRQGWRAAAITGGLIGDVIAARRRLEPALKDRRIAAREHERLLSLAHVAAAAASGADRKALSTARSADREILHALAHDAGRFVARWLDEAWDHAARVAHALDAAGAALWPIDRRPLLDALAAGDAIAAGVEIERDIAHFENACMRLILRSPAFADDDVGTRSARRWKRPAAQGESAVLNEQAGG